MIVSVHIADVGPLRAQRMLFRRPRVAGTPGMISAEPAITAPLGTRRVQPNLSRIGLIAAWEDDDALDSFLASHSFGRHLVDGWHVRLQPLRCFGSWSAIPGLPTRELPVEDDEPVVALTLGRLRIRRARPFLSSAAPAERDAVTDPAVIASIGFARPALPRLVSTFSIWRSAAAMRAYAFGSAGSHQAAVRADRARPFHHESAFVRFRPLCLRGQMGRLRPAGDDLVRAGTLEHFASLLGKLLCDEDFPRPGGEEVGYVEARGPPQHARDAVLREQPLDHFRLRLLLGEADLDQLSATRRQARPPQSCRRGSKSP
jgi:hypothetical protein